MCLCKALAKLSHSKTQQSHCPSHPCAQQGQRPSQRPAPSACSALWQQCDSQQRLVVLKPISHTPRPEIAQGLGGPRPPRVNQTHPISEQHRSRGLVPTAALGPSAAAPAARWSPAAWPALRSLLISVLQPETWEKAARHQHPPPREGRPSAFPRLGGFAKRSPGRYLPELVSSSRRQMLGPPSSELVPSRAGRGARGGGVAGRRWVGGCWGPRRCKLPAADSPGGESNRSAAEGSAREGLYARRPLKDMPESGWELPARAGAG